MNWERAGQQAGMTEADSQAAHRSPLNYPLMMSERLNVKCLPFVSVCVCVLVTMPATLKISGHWREGVSTLPPCPSTCNSLG